MDKEAWHRLADWKRLAQQTELPDQGCEQGAEMRSHGAQML
jgi:hypothetical protein